MGRIEPLPRQSSTLAGEEHAGPRVHSFRTNVSRCYSARDILPLRKPCLMNLILIRILWKINIGAIIAERSTLPR